VESHRLIDGLAVASLRIITFVHIPFRRTAPKYIAIRDPLRIALVLVRRSILFNVFRPHLAAQ